MFYGAAFLGLLVSIPTYPLPRRGVDVAEEVLQLAIQVRGGRTADRIKALNSLADLREKAKPALGTVCEVLYEPALQLAAANAVRLIAPELYPSVETLLFNRGLDRQLLASARLGQIGDASKNTAPFLREHAMRVLTPARPGEADLRAAVAVRDAVTLARVAPEYAGTGSLVNYLLGRAEDEARPRFSQADRLDLVNAAIVLYNHRPEEHRDLVPHLLRALDGPSRLEVIQLIGRNPLGTPEVVRRLRGLAAGTHSQVRNASAETLKKIHQYLEKLGKVMPP